MSLSFRPACDNILHVLNYLFIYQLTYLNITFNLNYN